MRDTDPAFAKYAPRTITYPEWYEERICNCPKFHYQNDWDKALSEFKVPPTCRECGKWADRVMTCCKCGNWFYHFFSHPSVGYHTKRGWFCWNCCIKFWPPVVEKRSIPREVIPPPRIVVPPNQTIMEYSTVNPF